MSTLHATHVFSHFLRVKPVVLRRVRLDAQLVPGTPLGSAINFSAQHVHPCSLGIRRKRYLDSNEKVPVRQPLSLAETIPAKAVALGHSSLCSPGNGVLIASKANHMQPAGDQSRESHIKVAIRTETLRARSSALIA